MKTAALILLLIPTLSLGWRICLDPGHGGQDASGTVAQCGAEDVCEKDVNLSV